MEKHVGFPVELLDMAKLEEYFADLKMEPDKFYDNSAQILRWELKNSFEKLREKVNKTDWKNHGEPAQANAFYDADENAIILPAGILQVVA